MDYFKRGLLSPKGLRILRRPPRFSRFAPPEECPLEGGGEVPFLDCLECEYFVDFEKHEFSHCGIKEEEEKRRHEKEMEEKRREQEEFDKKTSERDAKWEEEDRKMREEMAAMRVEMEKNREKWLKMFWKIC
jgi:septin family protein